MKMLHCLRLSVLKIILSNTQTNFIYNQLIFESID